ncbi:MAG: DUF3368 domain-containing protein [Acidobacteria bacterium]|nr:DUF3368 domain-containing protein [Acidobacteriota bacterium]
MPRTLVVNTSPLVLLHAVNQLELLHKLSGDISIPVAVLDELEAGAGRDMCYERVRSLDWIRVEKAGPLTDEIVRWDLGAGEAEVLALGLARPESTVVIDDLLGRRSARSLGIGLTGTIGIVLAAKQLGLLDRARPVIEELVNHRLYIDAEILARVLRGIGEP